MLKIEKQTTFCYSTTNTEALNTILLGLIRVHKVEIQQVIRTSEFDKKFKTLRSMDEASYIVLALVPEESSLYSSLPK